MFDVDHKNGDAKNSKPDNLWTLCPTCHRIKTISAKENLKRVEP